MKLVLKEFKIGDVFEKINTPNIKAKANDFPTSWSDEYCIPLLTAGINNQGLARYAKKIDCPMILKNCISVSANGANSGATFYQPNDFAVLQDSYAVQVIEHVIQSVEEGLYLATALGKAIRYNHDWNNKAGWNKIKTDYMALPVVESTDANHAYTIDDIDWQCMKDHIAELEQDCITNLDVYLKVTGLDDYELTDDDKRILSLSQQFKGNETGTVEIDSCDGEVKFGKFLVSDLFDVINNPQLDKRNFTFDTKSAYPYFTRTENNNGILGYVEYLDDKHLVKGNSLAVGMISMRFHYMQHDFYAGQFTKTLLPKFDCFNETIGLYFASILNKHSSYYQGYLVRHFTEKVDTTVVSLPVTQDGHIDFDYIERYVRAIEKQAIADVVRYKDEVIATTKSIVADAA